MMEREKEEPQKTLNVKQLAFVEHYLKCWNASGSARAAGYSKRTAGQIGHELLKKPEILEAIQRRLADLTASADEVLVRLTDHARGSMGDFLAIGYDGEPNINLTAAKSAGKLHLIKKARTTRRSFGDEGEEVVTEIELYDAQAALVHLGRKHGLFVDKVSPTNPDGNGPATFRIEYVNDWRNPAAIPAPGATMGAAERVAVQPAAGGTAVEEDHDVHEHQR
jgi:phage terminase small subunit